MPTPCTLNSLFLNYRPKLSCQTRNLLLWRSKFLSIKNEDSGGVLDVETTGWAKILGSQFEYCNSTGDYGGSANAKTEEETEIRDSCFSKGFCVNIGQAIRATSIKGVDVSLSSAFRCSPSGEGEMSTFASISEGNNRFSQNNATHSILREQGIFESFSNTNQLRGISMMNNIVSNTVGSLEWCYNGRHSLSKDNLVSNQGPTPEYYFLAFSYDVKANVTDYIVIDNTYKDAYEPSTQGEIRFKRMVYHGNSFNSTATGERPETWSLKKTIDCKITQWFTLREKRKNNGILVKSLLIANV